MPGNERDLYLNVHERRDGHALADAANDMDRLGDSTDRTATSTRHFTSDTKSLHREIEESRRRIRDLNMEWARTRDNALFGDIRKEEQNLRRLQRVFREVTNDVSRAGRNAGGWLGTGIDFSQGASETRGILIGGLVYAAAAAAPFIGAAVAGAVIGGVGVGGIIGGTIAAAHDQRVRDAFGQLGDQMSHDIKVDADPLVVPLQKAAKILGKDWAEVSRGIGDIFTTLAPGVEPLAKGIGGFADELIHGFGIAAKTALPILQDLEHELPELGAAFGDFFTLLANKEADARGGFEALMGFLEGSVRGIGAVTAGLSSAYQTYDKMPGWAQGLIATFPVLEPAIAGFIGIYKGIGIVSDTNGKAIDAVSGKIVPDLHNMSSALATVTSNVDDADKKTREYVAALNSQYDITRRLANDSLGFNSAILDMDEALQQNGATVDDHTRAGIQNIESIQRALDEARQKFNDMVASGKYSLAQADAEYEASKKIIEDHAHALGINGAAWEATGGAAERAIDRIIAAYIRLFGMQQVLGLGAQHGTPFGEHSGPNITSIQGGGVTDPYGILPAYDSGGYVAGPIGAAQLAVVHGGERVLTPAQQAMGGGGSVVISFAATGDPFLDAFVRELRRYVRITGGTGSDSVQVALGQAS